MFVCEREKEKRKKDREKEKDICDFSESWFE